MKHLGGHKGRTHIDKGILQFAKEVLDCKSVVDIGCGPGGQVYEALNLGMNAMGVDGDTT
jgi:ribosomal protein L11 methylase PrmA